jgi:hypothetical protein
LQNLNHTDICPESSVLLALENSAVDECAERDVFNANQLVAVIQVMDGQTPDQLRRERDQRSPTVSITSHCSEECSFSFGDFGAFFLN